MDPVREQGRMHQCVCLLIKGSSPDPRVIETMQAAAEAAGIPNNIIENILGIEDKCKQLVASADQPFCDDCEELEHHLLPNQVGMRNIVKENTHDPATER